MAPYSELDLHTHTRASDGTLTPQSLVETAIRRGLRVLAITDHDSTEGLDEAIATAQGSRLTVWPGIEISTDVPGTEVHVLGYLIDYHDQGLQDILRRLRESRSSRARRMVKKLAALGMPVSWQRVTEIAGGGSIGRPHVAQALLEGGFVASIPEAFDRFIGRNGPAYVERYRLTPEEAVHLIVRAKGLPSLAHPVIVGTPGDATPTLDLPALLPGLVSAGLAGLECYYPGYDLEIRTPLLREAARWDLVPTGGSDFHGLGTLTTGVGEVNIPKKVIDHVLDRHSRDRGSQGGHDQGCRSENC